MRNNIAKGKLMNLNTLLKIYDSSSTNSIKRSKNKEVETFKDKKEVEKSLNNERQVFDKLNKANVHSLQSKLNSETLSFDKSEKSDYLNLDDSNDNIAFKKFDKEMNMLMIPKLKLSKKMSYDSIQLIESLKYIQLEPQNINKMIEMISIIRKKKQLDFYNFEEIINCINYLRFNISNISPSYLVNFLFSLSKMYNPQLNQLKDEHLIIFEVVDEINKNISALDLRSISNLTFALSTLQLKSLNYSNKIKNYNLKSNLFNFDEYFSILELEIIKKLSKFTLDSQSASNIILSYSKTQNGSLEFFKIFEEIIFKIKEQLKPCDLAIILYSYSNNANCDDKIFEFLEFEIFDKIEKFSGNELSNILRAYDKRNKLNLQLCKIFMQVFIEKHETMNSYNLTYFYSILCDKKFSDLFDSNEFSRFLKYIHKLLKSLYFNLTSLELSVLMERAKFIQSQDSELFEILKNRILKLISRNDIKGFELKKIHENVKDLQFEGKYNLFLEKIEQHLSKLRYY